MNRILAGMIALVTLQLCGCGLLDFIDRGDAYEESQPSPPLEVPPDLSRPVEDPGMNVPETTSPAQAQVGEAPEPPDLDNTPLPEAPDIELPRDDSGAPYLVLQDSIQSAWRRTGYALERTGFTIESRDDARWLYAVRYSGADEEDDDGGFFGWLFGNDDEKRGERLYQVSLVGAGEGTTNVVVLDETGEPDSSEAATRILALLATRLQS